MRLDIEREIKKTLCSIIIYSGGDIKCADHAQLISEVEGLANKLKALEGK